MIILITGGTGYLGSNLVKVLRNKYEIYCFVRNKNKLNYLKAYENCVEIIDSFELIPSKVDFIIHTATNYGRAEESSIDIFKSNVIFPIELIENLNELSDCVFLNIDTVLPKEVNLYALTKKHFNDYLRYKKSDFKSVLNIKFDFMYGPKESSNKFTQYLLQELKSENRIALTPGGQIRNFLYIDDLIDALVMIISNFAVKCSECEKYNEIEIATNEYHSIKEYIEILHKLSNSKVKLGFGDIAYRADEQMNLRLDNSKLLSLGWNSKFTLEQGLRLCVEEV